MSPKFQAATCATPSPGLRRTIRAAALAVVISSEASLNLCTLIATRTLPRHSRPKLLLREVGSPSIALHRDPYRQNRIAYLLLRRLYRYADRIVVLTAGAGRDLIKNFSVPETMIALMATNAVIPPDMVARLARWDGESGREDNLIVSVGRLSPEKDQLTLLRALTLLPAGRQWRLAIVGDGRQRPPLGAALTPVGDAAAALMARGSNYTTARAAERFLDIIDELQPAAAAASGRIAVASAS